jgi:hypothetical protein
VCGGVAKEWQRNMSYVARKGSGILVLVLGLLVVGAATASAQMLRDFTGKVDSISEKAILVDNRKGDKIKFEKFDGTTVAGEKTTWDEIKKNDWVTVSSNMMEKPKRKAYKVTVIPPKEEAGEEVE